MIRQSICLLLLFALGTTEGFLLRTGVLVFRNRHYCHNQRHPQYLPPISTSSLWAAKKRKATTNTKRSSATGFGSSPRSSSSNAKKAKAGSRSRHHSSSSSPSIGIIGSKALRKAANHFDELYKQHGVEACRDVYVRSLSSSRSNSNNNTTCWFVGKIAYNDDSSNNNNGNNATTTTTSSTTSKRRLPLDHEVAVAQKRLILEYAKTLLRPLVQNMADGSASDLELWLAPGNSEMDVVQNKVTLQRVSGTARDLSLQVDEDDDDDDDDNRVKFGFNPEIYVGDEVTRGGLRVERDEQGRPIKPVFEINESM